MDNLNNMMDFADILNENKSLKPLMDLITQIMEIPEENLNENSIEVILGMIKGAFTDNMRQEIINGALNSFEENNFTRTQVKNLINTFNTEIINLINSLHPSENKNRLLIAIFNPMIEMFNIALEHYHTYDFELPIKLDKGGRAPTYAHETDACADVYALKDTTILAHSLSTTVPTGLRIALPEGWVAKIAPRSSIGAKTGLRLSNSIGIIDADYRGEIGVLYDNFSDSDYEIKAGDRIAQIWIEPVHRFKPVEVDILSATERGEGGFGSSGK